LHTPGLEIYLNNIDKYKKYGRWRDHYLNFKEAQLFLIIMRFMFQLLMLEEIANSLNTFYQ
jgi:hypothetical protein